jgi:hypothetical protein
MTASRGNGERSIRLASWLFLVNGVVAGLASIPFAIYIHRLGRLPRMGPIVGEAMSGPISARFGSEAVVWLLVPMSLLGWTEVLAGWWLRRQRQAGGWLAIVLLPVSMFFWIGFLMPIYLVLGPIRIALVLRGWRSLR